MSCHFFLYVVLLGFLGRFCCLGSWLEGWGFTLYEFTNRCRKDDVRSQNSSFRGGWNTLDSLHRDTVLPAEWFSVYLGPFKLEAIFKILE